MRCEMVAVDATAWLPKKIIDTLRVMRIFHEETLALLLIFPS